MPAPFADLTEMSERLGVPSLDPQSADGLRAQAALDDASSLIRAEGLPWEDPGVAPDILRMICLAAAIRAYRNPDGTTQASVGDVAVTFVGSEGSAIYLLKPELRAVRRAAGRSQIGSLVMTSDLTGFPDPHYVPVDDPGADLLPLGPWPWET